MLVAADGRAILADFGVSRFSDEGLKRELAVEPTMVTEASSAKVVLGRMSYLAPEVKRGETATARSDMYALGVSLFRLLTGVWYEPGTGALSLLDPFDPAWKGILPALLDEDPAKRSMPPRRRARRGRFALWAALAAMAALVAAALALHLKGRVPDSGEPAEPPPADEKADVKDEANSNESGGGKPETGRELKDLFFVPK